VVARVAGEEDGMISHERDLADQDVEELAEELWTLAEEGLDRVGDLLESSRVVAVEEVLDALRERGLARLDGGHIRLTAAGRELAQRQVRRHRLAEMLLITVLEVADDAAANRTACVMEHVLDASMTDSVCAFLGHPQRCPHGKPIPPGACCRTFSGVLQPLVQPLHALAPGEAGRVVHIVPRDPERLVRLASLGLVPGAAVHLQQSRPALVLRVGHTTLALESSIASEIFVKRLG
jgi:DtxR family Mn-dependent transcriptional regulator